MEAAVLEILVLEGQDAGQQFTVDGPEVAIGRGTPRIGQPGAILLTDPTVSSQQAVIRTGPEGTILEHQPTATNPTLVNDVAIQRQRLAPGDRIQMGRVLLGVRSRGGTTLSGFASAPSHVPKTVLYQPNGESTQLSGSSTDGMTEMRVVDTPNAHLTLLRGVPGSEGQRYPLGAHRTTLGRHRENDVHVPHRAVSRRHAELVWQGDELILHHLSETNPTLVNGVAVEKQHTLHGGDEIQLADQVVLRLHLEAAADVRTPSPGVDREPGSLKERLEEKVRRDQEIEKEFRVVGSFVDLDVVDSHGLKAGETRPEHIILSFERFRAFVGGIVEEFGGQVLCSNGDELMCFFEAPIQAVRSASAVLKRLEGFNEKKNLLGRPFRVRQGVHTGSSLVDRKRGVAYSAVLDVAGHLQKYATTNGVLVSEDTLKALPEGLPFEPADRLPKEGIPTYRLVGSVD